jgi:hypothetical protein
MARKPKAKLKVRDMTAAFKAGLLKVVDLPDDIKNDLIKNNDLKADVVVAVANEDFVVEHTDDFVDMFLEKTTRHSGLAGRNADQRHKANRDYEQYRAIAAEIIREFPHLAEQRRASQLANRVRTRLKSSRSTRTIIRALKK